jgi:hypothetical protein
MRLSLLAVLVLQLWGCGRVRDEAREALNKGGELAGSAAGEVMEGVATGVEESWSIDVQLDEALQARGLALGQVQVLTDSAGRDNQVLVYCSTTATFADTLEARAYDQEGSEMGRASVPVSLAAGGADHFRLQFQPFTDLERKCRVVLQ